MESADYLYLIPIFLLVVYVAMTVAMYVSDKMRNYVAPCFGSDPDPGRQAYLCCRDCQDREECLK